MTNNHSRPEITEVIELTRVATSSLASNYSAPKNQMHLLNTSRDTTGCRYKPSAKSVLFRRRRFRLLGDTVAPRWLRGRRRHQALRSALPVLLYLSRSIPAFFVLVQSRASVVSYPLVEGRPSPLTIPRSVDGTNVFRDADRV